MLKTEFIMLSFVSVITLAGVITAGLAFQPSKETALPIDADKMAELFSPAGTAQSICGPAGQRGQQPSLLKQAFEAAAMSKAYAAEETEDEEVLPPLYSDLGTIAFTVTTESQKAQAYFNQGLRFITGFNHAEAVRSFQAAQSLDPECAMCDWGEAYALGPNINAAMSPEAGAQALKAAQRAEKKASEAAPREQALIAALQQRYGDRAAQRPGSFNTAFADAMIEVQAAYPEDHEIALLTADAIMTESPWQYWEADGRTSAGRVGTAIELVEGVLSYNPKHPGAIHQYIHLVEASTTPERAEPYADQMHGLMPGAGHIVHMPSHIYYRIGRYLDSLETNIEAVAVDEAYFQRPEAIKGGMYEFGYYPHNIHFVLVSAQMAGDRARTLAFADKLDALLPIEMVNTAPWVQPVKASSLFAYAQYGSHEQVMALPDPGELSPYVKAMWHYARAVSLAGAGDSALALNEVDEIAALNEQADFRALVRGGVPAPTLLSIAQQVALGRIAQTDGNLNAAIQHFEAGVSLQDTVNYMEPPYWYYPVRQSLGAAYMAAGRTDDAVQVFKASLINAPNNGLVLYGLLETYKTLGDDVAASATEDLLLNAWAGEAADLDLRNL
ncbi:MAG: hypothetical protein RIB43_09355 [Rhodospirillaceae bacterium]